MDRSKRIFRVLVSLLLVCALIVNISPIRARAVVPEATAIGLGLLGLLLVGYAGVVFHPNTANDFVGVGNSFINYMSDWGSKNDKSEIVDVWIEGVNIDLTGGGGNSPLHIPPDIQLAVAQWIVDLLGGDAEIELEGEVAPEGYAYFNGHLLPTIKGLKGWYDTTRSNFIIYYNPNWDCYMVISNTGGRPFFYDSINVKFDYVTTSRQYVYRYKLIDGAWQLDSSDDSLSDITTGIELDWILWSYTNIYGAKSSTSADTSKVMYEKCDFTSSYSGELKYNALLGDVAPGIQEGTHTADDIELPEYVDVDSSIKYQGLVGTEAVQKMLHDMSTQELTFEEYKSIVGSGISGDTGDLGGDSGDGSDETQPVVPPYTDILDGLQGVQDGISQLPDQIGDSISDIMNQGQSDAQNTGQSGVDQIIDIIPDQSGDLMAALTSLTDVLSYEGTACVLPVPAIRIPALPGLFHEITVMEESELDLEQFFQMIPEAFITLVRALFDTAVVGFCLKEFLGLLAGLANGFSKPVDQAFGGDD